MALNIDNAHSISSKFEEPTPYKVDMTMTLEIFSLNIMQSLSYDESDRNIFTTSAISAVFQSRITRQKATAMHDVGLPAGRLQLLSSRLHILHIHQTEDCMANHLPSIVQAVLFFLKPSAMTRVGYKCYFQFFYPEIFC